METCSQTSTKRNRGNMSGAEWIYKYVFRTKYLNLAKLKGEDKFLIVAAKNQCPYFIIEYKWRGYWSQIGFL